MCPSDLFRLPLMRAEEGLCGGRRGVGGGGVDSNRFALQRRRKMNKDKLVGEGRRKKEGGGGLLECSTLGLNKKTFP